MTAARDRRRWPANARVAAARLAGTVADVALVTPWQRGVALPVADLLAAPDGTRDRQLLLGEQVDVIEDRAGWCFVECKRDGYTGYVASDALTDPDRPTHRVSAAATHVYPDPGIKGRERLALSLGALLRVTGRSGSFAQTPHGYVHAAHLTTIDTAEPDPVAVAERLLHTPYLWGGNSRSGIDCSGLVQLACIACAIPCPGDSDMQERELGTALPPDAPLQRGDLMFWRGHVAWVADATRILHANAGSMSVAYEDRETAIARINAAGDGPVTSLKRL